MSLFQGILVGLAVAAPLGPIALLCVEETISRGLRNGLLAALGIAIADILCASIAMVGLASVSEWIAGYTVWLRLIGVVVLCVVGVRMLMVKEMAPAQLSLSSGVRVMGKTFALSFLNPFIIVGFGALLSLVSPEGVYMTLLGIFCGSFGWLAGLAAATSWMGHRLSPKVLLWVRRWVAITIMVMGLGMLAMTML